MTLPVNVTTCTAIGAFVNSDGTTPSGTVEFVPQPPRLLDATATPPATILAVPKVVALDATGAFTVTLAATDAAVLNPVDWTYLVRVRLGGISAYHFDMSAPAGETIDLAEVTPVTASTGEAVLGGTGPPGADGADGVDGVDGADGADGVGVPVGGSTGQALTKTSATDYATNWTDVVANSGGITAMQAITQTAYDALTPPDPTTFYVITGP